MHTVFSAIATMGLLKNQGFAVNANLVAQTSTFANLDITQAAQGCLASTGGQTAAVAQALYNVPGFLTGMVSNVQQYTDNQTIINSLDSSNIVANITVQANTLFDSSPAKFLSVLARAKSFAESSYDSYATAHGLRSTTIDSFGFTVNNYTDILTTGISSQFNLVGGLSNQSFIELARQFKNFGTLFDINNLSLIDQPYVLCLNLLNQGFSSISDALISQSIDINSIELVDRNKLLTALKTIIGADLASIVTETGFKPQITLTSLADVFDIKYLFTSQAARAAGGSLSALGNKFLNIGGKYNSFIDLSDFLLGIQYDLVLSVFEQVANLDSLTSNISVLAGQGSGVFNNPTVDDIIGSVAGTRYNDLLANIISSQTTVISTTAGQALKTAILSAYNLDVNDAQGTQAANLILQRTTELISSIPAVVTDGNIKFNQLVSNFVVELRNYQLIKTDLEDLTVNVDAVNTFARDLVNVHADPKRLGYANYIKNAVDSSIYGSAIRAAIVEGQNINSAQQHSLQIPTRIAGT